MQRECDLCGTTYEAKRTTSRFHDPKCRVAWAKGKRPTASPQSTPENDESENIAPALREEFAALGVLSVYEARTALKLARQLDSGAIVGAAFTSLSKELDRRVDALRLKAERPDDPIAKIRGDLQEHQLRLVQGDGA